jgi:Lrp/AsnC family transcriptional regulator for asnA, asnC and gidA
MRRKLRGKSTENIKLDAFDAKIIMMLHEDGRRALSDIARELHLAEATVRKRVDALLKNEIIRISAWADPLLLGFQSYANVEIVMDPRYIEAAAAEIATFPEVFFLGVCAGDFDILAVCLFRSNEHMYDFLTHDLAHVQGVRRTTTSSIIRTIKRQLPVPPLYTEGGAVEVRAGKRDGKDLFVRGARPARERARARRNPRAGETD